MKFKNDRLQYYFDLIIELVKKEVKVRYKNSFLGYLWSILSPLLSALIFFIAFKVVIRLKIDNYVLFLISGLFCWQWYTNSAFASSTLFLNNATLIKKVNFPRDTLVYSMVISDLLHFLLSIPVILFFIYIYRQKFPYFIFLVPVLAISQFFLISGVSLIISSINLFFRDLERLVVVFTNLLFYMTPIIYSENMIPERYKVILYINPLSCFVISYRNVFMFNKIQTEFFALAVIYSFIVYYIGYKIYSFLKWKFAEIV
ncbi:MAG: ABC transporter permease [Endomicrobia bacterium]|nr:ABC transporter permease [Endomicrobiia bacterium]